MLFSEVIRVENGHMCDFDAHERRMQRTCRHFFGCGIAVDRTCLTVPQEMRSGLVKCRILYGREITEVTFAPYVFRSIRSLAVVEDDAIEYDYKYADRSALEALRQAGGCDDVLIVKDGVLTDTSFSNVVLEDGAGNFVTPVDALLKGTRREGLLRSGRIAEKRIAVEDISGYRYVYLINAMIGLEDCVRVATEDIVGL